MTDKEKIENVFREVGIEFEPEDDGTNSIRVWGGYESFYFFISFNDYGKMTKYGSYE
jgi:hypothetical protein